MACLEHGLALKHWGLPIAVLRGFRFLQEVPAGADAYLMKGIIHNWDDERARVILHNCREALRDGRAGKLLLVRR
jgi:hypothetical protein